MKAIYSLGLLCVLFACAISFPDISTQEVDEVNYCIVNVTEKNCTKCKIGTYQSDPDDPTMFYQCSNGLLYPKHCEPNTVWDEISKTCNNQDIYDSNGTCIVNITMINCTKCEKGTYAPYPDDPTMYYQCDNGELVPMKCKPDTMWNQTVQTCVADDLITTSQFDSSTDTSTHPTKHRTTVPVMSTSESSSQTFDGASFGGGIVAGIGVSLIVLLLVRYCCNSSGKNDSYQNL